LASLTTSLYCSRHYSPGWALASLTTSLYCSRHYSPGWALASLTTSLLCNLAGGKAQLWDIRPFGNNTRSDMPECPEWCDVKILTASCNPVSIGLWRPHNDLWHSKKSGVFWDVTPCGSWYFFAACVGC
jgi:hypothetical protein